MPDMTRQEHAMMYRTSYDVVSPSGVVVRTIPKGSFSALLLCQAAVARLVNRGWKIRTIYTQRNPTR